MVRPWTLDDLDQGFEEVTPHHGIQAEGGIIENEQFRVLRHRQSERHLGPLAT